MCSNPDRSQFSIQLSIQDFSSHTTATSSSDATKLRVLGKCVDTRNAVVPSPARTVWVQIPTGSNFFDVGIRKYFFTDCTAMQSSNEAKLMELIKHIIRQNAVVKLSYPTGVGSNPARSQFFFQGIFQYFSCIGNAMLDSSDMKLGVLGVIIIALNVV